MVPTIVLPGIGGADGRHWQTYWEKADPAAIRFRPKDWNRPDLADWIDALDRSITAADKPPLLVAHSLACLLVARWAAMHARPVRGAFLVAVPDPMSPSFPTEETANSFANVPDDPFPFPAVVVASSNDPFGSLDYARRRATDWRTGFVTAGALGHINGASQLAEWPQGMALFEAFRAGLGCSMRSFGCD